MNVADYFKEKSLLNLNAVSAIAIGDINGDGRIDLVAMTKSGSVFRISDENNSDSFQAISIAEFSKDFCILRFNTQTVGDKKTAIEYSSGISSRGCCFEISGF